MSETLEIVIKTKDLFSKQLALLGRTLSKFGTSTQKASKDINGLEKATEGVDKEFGKVNNQLNKTNKTLKSVGVMAGSVSKNFNSFKSSIFSLKTALLTFVAGSVAKGTLGVAENFEKFETALITITGSAQKAKQSMDWISEFTAKTPYELSQVADGFIKLGAYGFDATKYLKILGDTASSMGKDLNMAVEAFADAATGEFERLKEFGIKSKTVGDEVTFSWVKNGVAMQKTVKKTQEEIITGLTEIWSDRFSGGMERFSKTWTGMWSNAKDQFVLFQKSIMEAGIFDHLKAGLSLVLNNINRLKKEGKLDEWAKKISDSIISIFENIAVSVAEFYDVSVPAIKDLLETLNSFWDWFTSLPGWIQKTGLVLGILGGPLGKLAAVAIMDITNNTIQLKDTLIHTYKVVADKGYREAAQLEAKFAALRKKSEAAGGVWKKIAIRDKSKVGEAEDTLKSKVQGIIDKIKEFVKEQKKAREAARGETVEQKQGTKQVITVSDVKKAESQLNRLASANKYFFAQLNVLYEKGTITSNEYFESRLSKLTEFHKKQKQILVKSINIETDPTKKLALEDQLFDLEQKHKIDLIRLEKDKEKIALESAEKRLQAQKLLSNIQSKAVKVPGTETSLAFEKDRSEMDARHAEELDRLTTLADEKFAIEQGYVNKIALLEDAARQQKIEKEKLLLDQEKAAQEARLNIAIDTASGISDAMGAMYELSGKKNKEFFVLSKAATIAQAVMTTYSNATKAYNSMASIPYVGPALGAAAAAAAIAMGMANVSKIRAQSFAEGGIIGGSSPTSTSDDKTINVTSGEYVQPVSAVNKYGIKIMDGIKKGVFPVEMFNGFNFSMPQMAQKQTSFADGGLIRGGPVQNAAQTVPKQQEIKIVNVIDPRQVLDVISSTPEGQDTILNVIDQRQTTARQILRTENDI